MVKKLTPEELRAVQRTELEILREIDRICRKNGIRYCVIAGTLLGAVRHGGFIPWDDDADVAMLRPDYDRFAAACARDMDRTRFLFQDHRTTPGYRWGYGKVRRRDTLFLRAGQEHMPYDQGIFVDVFPLDAVPDSPAGRLLTDIRCFAVRKFLWSKAGKVSDPSPVMRRIYALMDRVPEKRILGRLEKLIAGADRSSRWVRILMFPTPNRSRGYLRRWYEDPEEVRFEGFAFPGAAPADEYLRFKFGDYRVLPPPEQQKTHPVSALKLADGGEQSEE